MNLQQDLRPPEGLFRSAVQNDLPWISELQKKLYPAGDAVPLCKLEEWFEANPSGFFIFENNGKRLGQITFLALKPDCLRGYCLEGAKGMIETEIGGDHIFRAGQKELVSDLYLESLILPAKERVVARNALMCSLPEMILNLRQNPAPGNVFALAATAAGEGWLTKMGFLKISRSEARRDRHNLYRVSLGTFLSCAAEKFRGQSKSET